MIFINILNSIKTFKFKSQSFKIFLFIFILFAIPMTVLYLMLTKNFDLYFYKDIYQDLFKTSSLLNSTITDTYDSMMSFCSRTLVNNDYIILSHQNSLSHTRYQSNDELYKHMRSFTSEEKLIDSVYIYSSGIDYIFSSNSSSPSSPQILFLDSSAMNLFNATEQEIQIRRFNNEYYISVAIPLMLSQSKNSVFIFNIRFSDIINLTNTYNDKIHHLYILDNNKNVLLSDNSENISKNIYSLYNLKEDFINAGSSNSILYFKDVFYINNYFDDYNFYVFAVAPNTSNTIQFLKYKNLFSMILIFILSIIVSFICAFYFYNSIYKIIKILKTNNKLISQQFSNEYTTNETNYIIKNINSLLSTNTEMQLELSNKINELHDAQIDYLQSQINPHFLFNTLNAINALIIEKVDDNSMLEDLIDSLSSILKYALDYSMYGVTLEEELSQLDHYINIQSVIHENSFTYECDIINETLLCHVPKLSLQPLVENAISHGLSLNDYKGKITISTQVIGDSTHITVSNTGYILNQSQVNYINNSIRNNRLNSGKSIGLANVDKRIKLLYGNKFSCYAEYNENHTSFIIKVPYSLK